MTQLCSSVIIKLCKSMTFPNSAQSKLLDFSGILIFIDYLKSYLGIGESFILEQLIHARTKFCPIFTRYLQFFIEIIKCNETADLILYCVTHEIIVYMMKKLYKELQNIVCTISTKN